VKDDPRHNRLRLLIKNLNKERKKQANQINVLCHGLVAAQKEFIKALANISFAADFYEALLEAPDLNTLLANSAGLIQRVSPQVSIFFLLLTEHTYELHKFESEPPMNIHKHDIRSWFTGELVANICRLNKTCNLADMYPMGLQAGQSALNKVSLSTIPLTHNGSSLGFTVLCSQREEELSKSKVNQLMVMAPGLSKAIRAKRPQPIVAK